MAIKPQYHTGIIFLVNVSSTFSQTQARGQKLIPLVR